MRAGLLLSVLLLAIPAGGQEPPVEPSQPFDVWLRELVAEAHDRGYSESIVNDTLAGLEPLSRVITNDRAQAELVVGF